MKTLASLHSDEPVNFSPKTDETWQLEYQACRYLEDLDDTAVVQRFRDILRNFMTIDGSGKLSPISSHAPNHGYFRIRLCHVISELRIRFGGNWLEKCLPDPQSPLFPDPRSSRLIAAATEIKRLRTGKGTVLFKYGRLEHIRALRDEGLVRVAAASSFQDAIHNDAIRDTELSIDSWIYRPTPSDLEDLGAKYNPENLNDEGSAVITRSGEDHHLFCVSAVLSAELFDDFDADACLVIANAAEFVNRLTIEVQRQLRARGFAFDCVRYVDPLTQRDDETQICFQKHFRYLYQREWRAVWLPSNREQPPETTLLKIGSLKDIGEILVPA
jgi:hypothetical protein